MKTTASARKTASRGRAAPRPAGRGTAVRTPAARPAVRKSAARPAARKPAARKPATSSIRKSRFTPPPPPPMYWICYDFTVKLTRGLCLGIAIGLFLTVVVPWMMDMGFLFAAKVQESDLAFPDISKMNFTARLPSWNETKKQLVDQSGTKKSGSSYLRPQPPLDPKVVADQTLVNTFPRFNRTMAYGMSISNTDLP